MQKICPHCNGTKKVRAMGMVYADCVICEATGKVDADKFVSHMPVAVPQSRESLPSDFYTKSEQATKLKNKDANYAYRNQPVAASEVQKLSDIGKPKVASKVAAPLNEDELASVRAQISDKARENAPTQTVELSPAMKAQLDALKPEAKDGKKAASR